MRPLKLHTKTTLVASAVTIGMLTAALLITSTAIANLEREDDKALAQLQAVNLATQISNMPIPRDQQDVARAADLVIGARPNLVSVRVWDRSGGEFVERVAASGSAPA